MAQRTRWNDPYGAIARTAGLGTSDVTVAPPPFDAEADALLEAASYGFNNPAANDRLAAVRARTVSPNVHITCDFCDRETVIHPTTGLYGGFALCRTHATAARKSGHLG